MASVLERRNERARAQGWTSYGQQRYWLARFRIDQAGTATRLADRICHGEHEKSEHADTPSLAVSRYLNYLKAVPLDKVIVTHAGRDDRRHWRWNGAAFTEQPVEWFRDRVTAGRDSR